MSSEKARLERLLGNDDEKRRLACEEMLKHRETLAVLQKLFPRPRDSEVRHCLRCHESFFEQQNHSSACRPLGEHDGHPQRVSADSQQWSCCASVIAGGNQGDSGYCAEARHDATWCAPWDTTEVNDGLAELKKLCDVCSLDEPGESLLPQLGISVQEALAPPVAPVAHIEADTRRPAASAAVKAEEGDGEEEYVPPAHIRKKKKKGSGASQKKKRCSHRNHEVWHPELPREQPSSAFYAGQGYTCKKCSRMHSALRKKASRATDTPSLATRLKRNKSTDEPKRRKKTLSPVDSRLLPASEKRTRRSLDGASLDEGSEEAAAPPRKSAKLEEAVFPEVEHSAHEMEVPAVAPPRKLKTPTDANEQLELPALFGAPERFLNL